MDLGPGCYSAAKQLGAENEGNKEYLKNTTYAGTLPKSINPRVCTVGQTVPVSDQTSWAELCEFGHHRYKSFESMVMRYTYCMFPL